MRDVRSAPVCAAISTGVDLRQDDARRCAANANHPKIHRRLDGECEKRVHSASAAALDSAVCVRFSFGSEHVSSSSFSFARFYLPVHMNCSRVLDVIRQPLGGLWIARAKAAQGMPGTETQVTIGCK